MQEAMSWLKEYQDSVESKLRELYFPQHSTALENAVVDALSGGGKRVRAALVLLWCQAYSGDYSPGIPMAAAYELAHASALVQDDIIDRSERRRGNESIVAKYGLSNAILASDLLLFYVPKLVARYDRLESARLAKLFDLVGEACRATTWGEFIDLEMAKGEDGTERDYEEMIKLKTSSLLSAPCASGAIVGGASEDQVALASRFGEALGMAYQIQDDALDMVGDEAILGKPVFTDLRGGKKSAILIHCASRCSDDDRNFIISLFNRAGPYEDEEVSRMKELIEKHGSLKYVRAKVAGYTREAKGVLEEVPAGKARSYLEELSDYLALRYS